MENERKQVIVTEGQEGRKKRREGKAGQTDCGE